MKGALSTRLIVWVGVPAALLFALVVGFGAARSYQQVAKNAERSSRALAQAHAAKLEVLLREAQKIPEVMAVQLERGELDTEEKIQSYMQEVLRKNRGPVYGSCVAFKPYGFAPDLNGYAPYYYWANDELLQFEQLAKPEYNYFQWDWYRRPRDAGHPVWSEPYFDAEGGQTLMITYSVPFRRGELFHGIVTIDIALAELLGQVQRIAQDEEAMLGAGGYAFIISKQGKFLAFPIAPGDTLFLFTDGVTEALNKSRDFYTPQRLQIILREVHAQPVAKITRSVVQDVSTFCGDHEQTDDISVMALQWLGTECA